MTDINARNKRERKMKGFWRKLAMWLDCILENHINKNHRQSSVSMIQGRSRWSGGNSGEAGEDPTKIWWKTETG